MNKSALYQILQAVILSFLRNQTYKLINKIRLVLLSIHLSNGQIKKFLAIILINKYACVLPSMSNNQKQRIRTEGGTIFKSDCLCNLFIY